MGKQPSKEETKKRKHTTLTRTSLYLSLPPLVSNLGWSLSFSLSPLLPHPLPLCLSFSLALSLLSAPSLDEVTLIDSKGAMRRWPHPQREKNHNPRCATSSKVPRDGCVCVCVFSPVSLEVCSLIHAPPSHASRVATPVRILWVFCMHAASPHPPESTLHLQRHTYHALRTAPMFAMMGLCVVRVRCGRDERGDRKGRQTYPTPRYFVRTTHTRTTSTEIPKCPLLTRT